MFVDVFGGSGLLARTVKDMYPDATVIFSEDLERYERVVPLGKGVEYLDQMPVDIKTERGKPNE